MPVGLDDSIVEEKVSELETEIRPGLTTRDELNRAFGDPMISNESWRLEVYAFNHNDLVSVWGWGIIPIPIMPAWVGTLEERVYLLVVYDEGWLVSDFDTGYFVEWLHEFRDHQVEDAEAAGFTFDLPSTLKNIDKAHEWLLAPIDETRVVLDDPVRDDSCLLFIVTTGTDARVFLDGEIIIDKRANPQDGFLVIMVQPGEHDIGVKRHAGALAWMDYKGEAHKGIQCVSGERRFVYIHNSLVRGPSYFQRYTLVSEFQVSETPLPAFQGARLALYHNGRWYGPDKLE